MSFKGRMCKSDSKGSVRVRILGKGRMVPSRVRVARRCRNVYFFGMFI